MKFVKKPSEILNHISTQALGSIVLLQGMWGATPQAWIDTLPDWAAGVPMGLTAVAGGIGILGKLIVQKPPEDKT